MKKNVCLFGLCHASEVIIDRLASEDIRVFCILDNSNAKQGMNYKGVPVKKPDAVMQFDPDTVSVIIASRFHAQMESQLRHMGFSGEIIKVGDYDSFEEFSLEDEVFESKKARVKRGLKLLNQFKKQKRDIYFVCPYNALGDVYHAMSLIPAYQKKNKLKTFAVCVTDNSCAQVAEIFGINPIVINKTQMDEFVQAIIYTRNTDFFIAHHDRPYTNNITYVLLKKHISFYDLYRYGVFGLDRLAKTVTPIQNKPFNCNGEILPGKTSILSPYAKSVSTIPSSFWTDLAAQKTSEGFLVLTNTFGDEKPIEGTRSITIPITELISAVEQAGHFIGIRSGLCDILITAKCEKTVVFPDSFYSYTNNKVSEFFALEAYETIDLANV
jgi:hypothetical protein